MKTVAFENRQYNQGPKSLFQQMANRAGAVWLDSSLIIGDKGHRSLMAVDPTLEVRFNRGNAEIRRPGCLPSTRPCENPVALVEQLVQTEGKIAVGYLSYEAMLPYVGAAPAVQSSPLDEAAFFLYDTTLRFEKAEYPDMVGPHEHGSADDISSGSPLSLSEPGTRPAPVRLTRATTYDSYCKAIKRIRSHIIEGDIYQANYTCRFEVDSPAEPADVYRKLRRLNPAPYAAYLNFGDYQILSSSPERMFDRKQSQLTSSPIKGTIARGRNETELQANLARLLESEKDRAELLMIVDLVRNDIGKVARTGTVEVQHLFRPEVYSSVIHLVAEVAATVEPSVSVGDICRALLPGGSITGAPKKRAVEIIGELEDHPRSVYTGCIGYINDTSAEFSIAIRTMYRRDGRWYVHAGGGIVADSEPEAEYEEMLLKARNLLRALEVKI